MSAISPSSKPERPSNVEYALEYADKGWHVFPVHYMRNGKCSCGSLKCIKPGKHPKVNKWNKVATTDNDRIIKLWDKHPFANIGIVTGKISNLIVLDIDPRNRGNTSLDQLAIEHPELSEALTTLSCTTGGNGVHYYFKWRDDQKTKHSAHGGGIDIQSNGAYVIAPPSNHVSGGIYQWNFDCELQSFPDCLLYEGNNTSPVDLRWNSDILQGQRNTTLASLAGSLFHKGFKPNQVLTKLSEENAIRCKPPLDIEEVKQIVTSIERASGSDKKSFKTKWQEGIVRSDIFNAQEVRTLMDLSLFMDIDGRGCFPSQETIAENTHTSRQTVNKHIHKAEQCKWLTSYARPTGKGKIWSKGYIATIPED